MAKYTPLIPHIVMDIPASWGKEYSTARGVYDPDTRTVHVRPTSDKLDELDTFVHEAIHSVNPKISEEETEELAYIIARVLWKAKYRKI